MVSLIGASFHFHFQKLQWCSVLHTSILYVCVSKKDREGEVEKTGTEGIERHCCTACVNVCSNSEMIVCALFCLCVYNESSVIGQVDVVSDGGRRNTLQ